MAPAPLSRAEVTTSRGSWTGILLCGDSRENVMPPGLANIQPDPAGSITATTSSLGVSARRRF